MDCGWSNGELKNTKEFLRALRKLRGGSRSLNTFHIEASVVNYLIQLLKFDKQGGLLWQGGLFLLRERIKQKKTSFSNEDARYILLRMLGLAALPGRDVIRFPLNQIMLLVRLWAEHTRDCQLTQVLDQRSGQHIGHYVLSHLDCSQEMVCDLLKWQIPSQPLMFLPAENMPVLAYLKEHKQNVAQDLIPALLSVFPKRSFWNTPELRQRGAELLHSLLQPNVARKCINWIATLDRLIKSLGIDLNGKSFVKAGSSLNTWAQYIFLESHLSDLDKCNLVLLFIHNKLDPDAVMDHRGNRLVHYLVQLKENVLIESEVLALNDSKKIALNESKILKFIDSCLKELKFFRGHLMHVNSNNFSALDQLFLEQEGYISSDTGSGVFPWLGRARLLVKHEPQFGAYRLVHEGNFLHFHVAKAAASAKIREDFKYWLSYLDSLFKDTAANFHLKDNAGNTVRGWLETLRGNRPFYSEIRQALDQFKRYNPTPPQIYIAHRPLWDGFSALPALVAAICMAVAESQHALSDRDVSLMWRAILSTAVFLSSWGIEGHRIAAGMMIDRGDPTAKWHQQIRNVMANFFMRQLLYPRPENKTLGSIFYSILMTLPFVVYLVAESLYHWEIGQEVGHDPGLELSISLLGLWSVFGSVYVNGFYLNDLSHNAPNRPGSDGSEKSLKFSEQQIALRESSNSQGRPSALENTPPEGFHFGRRSNKSFSFGSHKGELEAPLLPFSAPHGDRMSEEASYADSSLTAENIRNVNLNDSSHSVKQNWMGLNREKKRVQSQPSAPHDGLTFEKIPGEGHCLFHAVGRSIGQDAKQIRRIATVYMEENPDLLIDFYQGGRDGFMQRIREIRERDAWGDDPEIKAIQRSIDQPIVILRANANPTIPDDINDYVKPPIFLFYDSHAQHYDVFLVKENFHAQDIAASIRRAVLAGQQVSCPQQLVCELEVDNLLSQTIRFSELFAPFSVDHPIQFVQYYLLPLAVMLTSFVGAAIFSEGYHLLDAVFDEELMEESIEFPRDAVIFSVFLLTILCLIYVNLRGFLLFEVRETFEAICAFWEAEFSPTLQLTPEGEAFVVRKDVTGRKSEFDALKKLGVTSVEVARVLLRLARDNEEVNNKILDHIEAALKEHPNSAQRLGLSEPLELLKLFEIDKNKSTQASPASPASMEEPAGGGESLQSAAERWHCYCLDKRTVLLEKYLCAVGAGKLSLDLMLISLFAESQGSSVRAWEVPTEGNEVLLEKAYHPAALNTPMQVNRSRANPQTLYFRVVSGSNKYHYLVPNTYQDRVSSLFYGQKIPLLVTFFFFAAANIVIYEQSKVAFGAIEHVSEWMFGEPLAPLSSILVANYALMIYSGAGGHIIRYGYGLGTELDTNLRREDRVQSRASLPYHSFSRSLGMFSTLSVEESDESSLEYILSSEEPIEPESFCATMCKIISAVLDKMAPYGLVGGLECMVLLVVLAVETDFSDELPHNHGLNMLISIALSLGLGCATVELFNVFKNTFFKDGCLRQSSQVEVDVVPVSATLV